MLEPNPTLYFKNIDWKIKKPLLRRALYALCSRHGKVLEIITLRREGLQGQAWVIMEDTPAATAVLQAENGFNFFGKDLVIEYARNKSDRIARRDGSYVPKAKRAKREATAENEHEEPPLTTETEEQADQQEPATNNTDADTPPSKYILAVDLPEDCNEMVLSMLFRQYTGYKETRMPRPGLAFVEFEDEPHATIALNGLNGFKLTQKDTLKLKYGKV